MRARRSSAIDDSAGVELLDRYGLGLPPRRVPFGHRTIPGQHLVEAGLDRLELLLVEHAWADAVTRLDLVHVADRLAPSLRAVVRRPSSCARSHRRRWGGSGPVARVELRG
ncbi:MAG: hypothetical protein U5R31_02420 [Acidimicrobiia bacterium]|nr:hypothetical protein [Acidimicrobiia bacterium]